MPLARVKKRVPVIMNYGLIERDYGRWDDMTFEEIEESDPEGYKNWHSDWIDFVIPDGESAAQVQSRINETISIIFCRRMTQGILLLSHIWALQGIYCRIFSDLVLNRAGFLLWIMQNMPPSQSIMGRQFSTGLNL